jgi:hypothetical protein
VKSFGTSSAATPMPVSCTVTTTPSPARRAVSVTPPFSVNFTALDSRLLKICSRRTSSVYSVGSSGSTAAVSAIFLSLARSINALSALSTTTRSWTGANFSVSRSASILEMSRMSLMSWSRFL